MPADPRPGDAPRPLLDKIVRGLGRLAVRTFYRRIEVTGLENVPRSGPVIVVANHANSLIDGVIIGSLLPRTPRFLTASTVWDFKAVVPVLRAAGVVPVYRRQDGRHEGGQLEETFETAADLLAEGGVLAIFPEGLSHNDSRLLPIKTGVARIALETLKAHPELDLKIVPVCLHYAEKSRFRSSVFMQVGTPIGARDELPGFLSTETVTRSKAVRGLKARVRNALLQVSLQSSTWEDVRLVSCAAEIWRSVQMPDTPTTDLPSTIAAHRRVLSGARWLRIHRPAEWTAIRRQVLDYADGLKAQGLEDRHVAAFDSGKAPAPFASVPIWVVPALPVALLGLVLNVAPGVVLWLMRRRKDPDKMATWSVFAGLMILPLYWVLVALVVGSAASVAWGFGLGVAAALVALVAVPATGLVAAKTWDVVRRTRDNLHAARTLAANPEPAHRLAKARAALVGQLHRLSKIYERGEGPVPTANANERRAHPDPGPAPAKAARA